MNLSDGIPTVAIPGPSILPDRVRRAMARPMPDIYRGEILDISDRILAQLPAIARTSGHTFIVISNGHGAWQMAISNTLQAGETVLVAESGRFATVWGYYAELAGVRVETLAGDFQNPVDPAALEQRLAADSTGSIKAVLVAHTDTASSVRNDIAALRSAVDAAGHDALLMVDCIASMACERFEMDEWGVDLALAASQKGLMCPPGLGFVWAGPRAVEAFRRRLAAGAPRVGYLDWERRLAPRGFYDTYAGTPPVAHLYALSESLAMIEEEGGLEAVWQRHQVLADSVRACVATWSMPGGVEFNIGSAAHRSNAVTTISTGDIDSEALRTICRDRTNLTLGIGLDAAPDRSFRIGHMGHLNAPMILGTLATVESALTSLEAPLGGSGVAAASELIAKSLRE